MEEGPDGRYRVVKTFPDGSTVRGAWCSRDEAQAEYDDLRCPFHVETVVQPFRGKFYGFARLIMDGIAYPLPPCGPHDTEQAARTALEHVHREAAKSVGLDMLVAPAGGKPS